MKKGTQFLAAVMLAALSFNVSAGIVVFNDRTAFQSYVGSFTLDNLDTDASGSGLDLSNSDYSWTMTDYACTNSSGCAGYSATNPFINGANDWVWTYGSGTFNFNFGITAFGLDYVNPYFSNVGQVGLNGFDSGIHSNGSFFGIATDDGSFLNPIAYTQHSGFQGFDNVTYSVTSRVSTVPEPATLALMGFGLAGIGFARKKKKA